MDYYYAYMMDNEDNKYHYDNAHRKFVLAGKHAILLEEILERFGVE